ncbi:hypothetical protein [Tuberibacillus sp. Marseille-P3662]|uniref:hypothetical protein n=1 Tax=Tuberibacillus sp. Marseille-P3662 TaxID=1965358 RepID=UPI000A1CBEC5|nr:hypothetical protein [Tuberibacillus sp. Marseille-P3662]
MRRKKGLVFVICLLALSGVMAAMSFSSATVNANAQLKVTNNSQGLLGILPGDSSANTKNDDLLFDLTEGTNAGMQPGSHYQWEKLFELKNNTNQPIDVKVEGINLPNDNVKVEAFVHGNNSKPITELRRIAPHSSIKVDLKVDVQEDASTNKKAKQLNITVNAKKAN